MSLWSPTGSRRADRPDAINTRERGISDNQNYFYPLGYGLIDGITLWGYERGIRNSQHRNKFQVHHIHLWSQRDTYPFGSERINETANIILLAIPTHQYIHQTAEQMRLSVPDATKRMALQWFNWNARNLELPKQQKDELLLTQEAYLVSKSLLPEPQGYNYSPS